MVQSASLTGPDSTFVNKAFEVTATFSPARPGRTVEVAQLVSGAWVTVATLTQDSAGRAVAPLTVTAPGSNLYRATTAAAGGLVAFASNDFSVAVAPDPVQVSPVVEVLDSSEVAAISSFDPTTGALVFRSGAPASVDQIVVGDVVPVPPRPGATSGRW